MIWIKNSRRGAKGIRIINLRIPNDANVKAPTERHVSELVPGLCLVRNPGTCRTPHHGRTETRATAYPALHAAHGDGRYNKVANIVGHTMQFHPHGDASIGDALVQLGQKDLLIDCQGNWGEYSYGRQRSRPPLHRSAPFQICTRCGVQPQKQPNGNCRTTDETRNR